MGDLKRYLENKTGFCFACRHPVRVMFRKEGNEINRLAETEICQNKDCVLFVDFKKIFNWKLKRRNKPASAFSKPLPFF